MRKLIAFANCHASFKVMSGGDIRFIQLFKRINEFRKIIVTSEIGKEAYRNSGLSTEYLITSKEKNVKNMPLTYIMRALKASFLKPVIRNGDILYSTSDMLPDVLPAFVYKSKNGNAKWIQLIFHICLPPLKREGPFIINLISFYAQKISFFFIKRRADLIIVDSHLLEEKLGSYGFDVRKIEVNYPGINTQFFKNIKPGKLKDYEGVFLGRLHPSKGIFDLVDIWENVCKARPDAKLAIIGGGDERVKKELKEKIMDVKLEQNIEIMGYLENDKAFDVVNSSKVFVFPSHEEGFGIAILEAMACGLPVVAWGLPVYKEIFTAAMIEVPIGKTIEFAEAILKLLDDVQLYEDMSKETDSITSRYDLDKMAKRELEIIETCIKNRVKKD